MGHLFDDLARKLATPTSRRTSFRLILGAAAACFLAACNRGCSSDRVPCGNGSGTICCPETSICCFQSTSTFCCSANSICCSTYCCAVGFTCGSGGTCVDPSGRSSRGVAPLPRS